MKKTPFVERLLNNWPAKIICFILALLIYAFYQITSVEKKNIAVPLSIKTDGNMVAANSLPSYVRVTIRGKQEDISAIQEHDISAFLDLSFYTESELQSVPVLLDLSETLTVMAPLEVSVAPEYISVQLEEKMFKLVPVMPVVQGNPARGYEVASYSITPSSVRITGPKSMVESVSEISTDIVSIDGAVKSVSQLVSLFNANSYISIDKPAESTVSVDIQAIQIERTFKNIPVFLYSIPENFNISQNKKLSVTISGPMLELEKYEFGSYTVQGSCAKITSDGDYSVPLSFNIPASFKIVSKTFDSMPVSAVYIPIVEQKSEENLPDEQAVIQNGGDTEAVSDSSKTENQTNDSLSNKEEAAGAGL